LVKLGVKSGKALIQSKNSMGFDRYFSIEINKGNTIYRSLPFSLQTFDVESTLKNVTIINYDTLRVSIFHGIVIP
jgi:UDP-galactopyranose mutase